MESIDDFAPYTANTCFVCETPKPNCQCVQDAIEFREKMEELRRQGHITPKFLDEEDI